jgi:phosphotransferase system HPr (HPr) family protein
MKRVDTWIQPAGDEGAGTAVLEEITIVNEQGLHARLAAEFVCAAKAFRSHIWLIKGGERFSAASILDVLIANLNCGETAVIEAQGPDAEEAVRRLVELAREFGKRDLNNKSLAFRRPEEDF